MNPDLAFALQLLNVLVLPLIWGGMKFIIRVEKKLTLIESKLGIEID